MSPRAQRIVLHAITRTPKDAAAQYRISVSRVRALMAEVRAEYGVTFDYEIVLRLTRRPHKPDPEQLRLPLRNDTVTSRR